MMLTSYLVFLVAAAALLYFFNNSSRTVPLPPGPPRSPFIGNLRHMPSAKASLVFHEWSKIYGDVIYLQVPGQSIIVLNTLQAAEDLLEKRSLIYSDRPMFPLFELFGWKSMLSMLGYGKTFMKFRQLHHAYLSRRKCADFMPVQLHEAQILVKNVLTAQSHEYEGFLSRFAAGIITQIVAGHEIDSNDDPYFRVSTAALQTLTRSGSNPGSTAIDFFPFLQHFPRWFPGTYYAGVADEVRPTVQEFCEFPVRTVRAQRDAGAAKPSFILTELEKLDARDSVTEDDYEDIRANAATMFIAGHSTTWSALSVFILAMVLHPACQARAQNEIDAVVGSSRLPEFEDRENLPYVESLVEEVFRWNPGAPLGVPHRLMSDDTYRGMFIPAGSIVFANIRAMTLDETIYSDPVTFSPERFLPKPAGRAEPFFSGKFGFGRRICTGQHLGYNSVWIAVASMLACCTITNAIDKHGGTIVPENEMIDGAASHPKGFQCVIKPRSARANALVSEALDVPAHST